MKTKEEAFVFMTFLCGVKRSGPGPGATFLFSLSSFVSFYMLHLAKSFFFFGFRVC